MTDELARTITYFPIYEYNNWGHLSYHTERKPGAYSHSFTYGPPVHPVGEHWIRFSDGTEQEADIVERKCSGIIHEQGRPYEYTTTALVVRVNLHGHDVEIPITGVLVALP